MKFRRRPPTWEKPHRSAPASDLVRPEVIELIDHMPAGVAILDRNLKPLVVNEAARTLLGIRGKRLPARLPTVEVTEVAQESIETGSASRTVEVWYPARLHLTIKAAALGDHGGVLVVVQDVTEEIRTQEVRKEFVGHASHELKSPVASLQALAEAVVESVQEDPPSAARFAHKIAEETQRLGQLIADLLDLSRLEEASSPPEDICEISAIASKEISHAERAAHEAGVSMTGHIQPGLVVRGDRRQLATLVKNLLDNAIRYTPPNGQVRIALDRAGNGIRLSVQDTGMGIPKEAQPRIFERFYRVDRARSRERGGTGLGLAIVKHAVELHGGTISVESELGTGSVFTALLPATHEAPAEPRNSGGPGSGHDVKDGS